MCALLTHMTRSAKIAMAEGFLRSAALNSYNQSILPAADCLAIDMCISSYLGRNFFPYSGLKTDLEFAVIHVEEPDFPDAEIKGCFFHFSRALRRRAQDLGLACMSDSMFFKT